MRGGGSPYVGLTYDPNADILIQDCTFEGSATAALELMEWHYTTGTTGPKSWTMDRCRIKKYDSLRKLMWFDLPCPTVFKNVIVEGGKHETLFRFWGGPPSVDFIYCTFCTDGCNGDGSTGNPWNTFVDGWDGGRTFNVKDCIFYSPNEYSPAFDGDAGSSGNRTYAIDHSIVKHGANLNLVGAHVTLSTGVGYSNSDPLFTNYATGDVTLTSGSPAKDAGVDIPGVMTDAAGNPRWMGTAPDQGALEFPGTPAGITEWSLF